MRAGERTAAASCGKGTSAWNVFLMFWWERTDVYFSFADKEIVVDYKNCDPDKEQMALY